jgi:hypothetical protein
MSQSRLVIAKLKPSLKVVLFTAQNRCATRQNTAHMQKALAASVEVRTTVSVDASGSSARYTIAEARLPKINADAQ